MTSVSVDAGQNPTIPVAIDVIGGADYQIVKLDSGAPGVSSPVSSSNPLPTTSPSIPYLAMRDPMNTMDTTKWSFSTKAASDLMYVGGNVASASWVGIVKSALVPDTYSEIISLNSWPLSVLTAAGLSISQRMQGQQIAYDIVGVDGSGAVVNGTSVNDIALANVGAVVVSNIVTFTSVSAHGLLPGDPIVIYGCTDPRMNVGPVVVTSIPSSTTFTVSNTIANATYTVGTSAFVRYTPYDNYSSYVASTHFAGTSSSNADAVTKAGDRQPQTVNWNPGNTATDAVIPSENGINYAGLAYSYPQRNREEFIMRLHPKHSQFILKDVDSVAAPRSTIRRTQNIPDASRSYKIRFRARNFPNMIVPTGYITAAVKTGTTTATLTIPNHGLTTSDYIAIVGIRDQTNFVNTTTGTVVASVIDANTITVVFGTAVTASSYGGTVYRVNGQAALPATTSSAVQTYAKTSDGLRLSLVFLASQGTTIIPGEVWTLHGLVNSSNTAITGLTGRYRVELSNTTTFTVELSPLDGQDLTGVSTTPASAGAGLVRNTELRLHFVRIESETNQTVEVIGAQGDQDQANAMAVNLNNQSVNILSGSTTIAGMSTQGAQRLFGVAAAAVVTNTDRASAALTASGNSGTIADDFGNTLSGLISVTAVSGTTPRLDIALQESFDNGTTWQDIWHAPRITANTTIQVPYQIIGGRRRWNYTVTGTTPSFTMAITTMRGTMASNVLRQFFDYSSAAGGTINANLTTTGTPAYYVENCKEFTVAVSMGAVTTTAPVLQVQVSPNAVDWYNVGSAITTAASTNYLQTIPNTPARYVRVIPTTAGVGATINYVSVTGR